MGWVWAQLGHSRYSPARDLRRPARDRAARPATGRRRDGKARCDIAHNARRCGGTPGRRARGRGATASHV